MQVTSTSSEMHMRTTVNARSVQHKRCQKLLNSFKFIKVYAVFFPVKKHNFIQKASAKKETSQKTCTASASFSHNCRQTKKTKNASGTETKLREHFIMTYPTMVNIRTNIFSQLVFGRSYDNRALEAPKAYRRSRSSTVIIVAAAVLCP